jgi:hypothetical protein
MTGDRPLSCPSGTPLRDVAIRSETGSVRFASASAFVRSYLDGSPLAPIAAAAPATAYDELVGRLEHALSASTEEGSLSFPIEAQLAVARA